MRIVVESQIGKEKRKPAKLHELTKTKYI